MSTEQQEFDAHMNACEVCRGQWLTWRRISDVFQVEPFTAPAPGFMLRVDQAVQRDEKRRERLWGGLVLGRRHLVDLDGPLDWVWP